MISKKKIRRRRFSDDFKKRVVAEASQPDTFWSEVALRYELKSRDVLIEKLKNQLAGMRRHRFGSRSEALDQLALLLENEEIAIAVDEV